MEANLRAGVAIFNAGRHHAAHDAWEDVWLGLESGTADERFLHGLIQYTAAVHHGHAGNWEGLRGLAESAAAYLDGLDPSHRGVNVGTVCEYLGRVAVDPEHIERRSPPELTVDDEAIRPADLDFPAAAVAAAVIAAEDGYDADVVDDAVRYAAAAIEANESNRFVALVHDFVTEASRRGLVFERLAGHVRRRRGEEDDVGGLFDRSA